MLATNSSGKKTRELEIIKPMTLKNKIVNPAVDKFKVIIAIEGFFSTIFSVLFELDLAIHSKVYRT
jgi:hypothetical protein